MTVGKTGGVDRDSFCGCILISLAGNEVHPSGNALSEGAWASPSPPLPAIRHLQSATLFTSVAWPGGLGPYRLADARRRPRGILYDIRNSKRAGTWTWTCERRLQDIAGGQRGPPSALLTCVKDCLHSPAQAAAPISCHASLGLGIEMPTLITILCTTY